MWWTLVLVENVICRHFLLFRVLSSPQLTRVYHRAKSLGFDGVSGFIFELCSWC